MQIPPTPSDLRSQHSVYSPASSIPRFQPSASSTYLAGHSPSRGAVPIFAPANAQYQQSMAMSDASLDRTAPSSRGAAQLPNVHIRTAPSSVPYNVPSETAEPTIKKRKRANARQLEALNGVYARTAFPSTEERQQLARDLDMSARSVQIWLAHTFLYTACIISELSTTILSGSKTKGRQAVKADKILPTLQSAGSM